MKFYLMLRLPRDDGSDRFYEDEQKRPHCRAIEAIPVT